MIYGDAWTWWEQAKDKYERGSMPHVGAIIVLPPQTVWPTGRVEVVTRIISPREIVLGDANWMSLPAGQEKADLSVILYDSSKANDWSEVKALQTGSSIGGGSALRVQGFIYPGEPSKPSLSSSSPDYVGSLLDAPYSNSPSLPTCPGDPQCP